MWTKDYYQEQMLGYLDWVQTEIEQLDEQHIRQNDLEIALDRLWWLIGATDVDWEAFRYTLEASCDELLGAFYRAPRAGSWIFSVNLTLTERLETVS